MAKYVAQVVIHGSKIVVQALARAFRQEYIAAASVAQKGSGKASLKTDNKYDITVQEAQDILNIKSINNPQEIEKQYSYLFSINDKSKGGSLYLQSKENLFCSHMYSHLGVVNAWRCYSKTIDNNIFSSISKSNFVKRLNDCKYVSVKRTKEASVMVPLCIVNNEPSILFTLRSATISSHKNDVSFPGGMRDSTDKDAVHAAIRETKEEIGVLCNPVDVWTVMNPLPGRDRNLAVIPVVTFIGNIDIKNCEINHDEVELVFTRPLKLLCDPSKWKYTKYKRGYTMPVYLDDEYYIWGLTAVILQIVLYTLLPEIYTVKLNMFS